MHFSSKPSRPPAQAEALLRDILTYGRVPQELMQWLSDTAAGMLAEYERGAVRETPGSVVYFIADGPFGLMKIGFTADLRQRLRQLRGQMTDSPVVMGYLPGGYR